jgi:hypothetical protein
VARAVKYLTGAAPNIAGRNVAAAVQDTDCISPVQRVRCGGVRALATLAVGSAALPRARCHCCAGHAGLLGGT